MPPPRCCLWLASVSVSPRQLCPSISRSQPGCPTLLWLPDPGGWKVQGGDAVQPPNTWGQDAWGCTRSAQAPSRLAAHAGAFPADETEALPIYGRILSSDATAVSGQIPGIPSPALPGKGPGARKEAGIFPGRRLPGPGKPQAWVQSVRGGRVSLLSPGSRPRASHLWLAPRPRRAHAV